MGDSETNSSENLIKDIRNSGFVVLNLEDLKELFKTVKYSSVNKNEKFLSHKEVVSLFGITNYWLKKQREDVDTELICIPGKHINSAWKYQVDSVRRELNRLAL